MLLLCRRVVLLSLTLALLPSVYNCAPVRADSPVRDAGIADTLRLMEQQRYPEAIPAAQLLVQGGSDGYSYCTHGALALEIGAMDQAQADFSQAAALLPGDPLPSYGLGLCALARHDTHGARRQFAAASDRANGTEQLTIVTATAAADAVDGNRSRALTELNSLDYPAAAELRAVLLANSSRSQSRALLETFLASGRINGVTRVTELPGIRLLCATSSTDPAWEPDVAEPMFQQDYSGRLSHPSSPGGSELLSGLVTLKTRLGGESTSNMVSLSVDGHTIGMNNAPPSQFEWDTRQVVNGIHQIVFSEINADGAVLATDARTVTVANGDGLTAGTVSPLPQDLLDRLWRIVSLKASYKVAEYQLAQECQADGDQASYADHILVAAALDPSYHEVHRRVFPLFTGRIPATYPLPGTLRLPANLGISAGQGSKAGFWAGSDKVREIALTFDDGPVPGPANALLSALEKSGAKATFFVVGMRAIAAPQCLQRMHADGDAVEDHTYTHPNLDQVLPVHMAEEILRTAVIIRSVTGVWPEFLRPPGGNTNPLVLMTARACGMGGAFWTVDAWPAEESGSPQAVTKLILGEARNGAIMLMHDGADATTAAIPALVAGLKAAGYKLVTLPQLAADALSRRGS